MWGEQQRMCLRKHETLSFKAWVHAPSTALTMLPHGVPQKVPSIFTF